MEFALGTSKNRWGIEPLLRENRGVSYGRYVKHRLDALSTWIQKGDWPRLDCPACSDGMLQPVTLERFHDAESAAHMERYRHGLDGPEDLSGTFIGSLRCGRTSCELVVAVAGDWRLVVDWDEHAGARYAEEYRVRYLNPALPLLDVPTRAPLPVIRALDDAAQLMWVNPSAAANQLRQAVEELLTSHRVRRYATTKKGRTRLTTHARIGLFRETRPDVAVFLEAVKWIGNSGSHDGDLVAADVLEGAELLSHALQQLYDPADVRLRARAAAVTKRRGRSTASPH